MGVVIAYDLDEITIPPDYCPECGAYFSLIAEVPPRRDSAHLHCLCKKCGALFEYQFSLGMITGGEPTGDRYYG